ncbi:MAG: hypothetical protein FWG77_01400 [Treponema sp.]|nr:hypothetical protein [Treponema sp.]
MARMTDEEAMALSDYIANNEITLGPNGSGWLAQREIKISGLSNLSIQYLLTKAKAVNKSPVQIIDELVKKELAATSA